MKLVLNEDDIKKGITLLMDEKGLEVGEIFIDKSKDEIMAEVEIKE